MGLSMRVATPARSWILAFWIATLAGTAGDFARPRCSFGESPWFVRPKGENSYDQTTGNQWNLRSVATAVWETAAFSPTPQLHRTLLGLLCYYSCYYFRSIWPLPAPA